LAKKQESPVKILVVDDEKDIRESCRHTLTPLGYTVDTAKDLATGLELVHNNGYELVLLDVTLPDGSGLDLITPFQQDNPNAICIIVTGDETIDIAIEAAKQRACDFLPKPFTADRLLVTVNQGLERQRLKAIEVQAKELARAKAELEQLDLAKSQLMLQVAHELRAPIAAVQSYIDLILRGWIPEDETSPTLKRVQERLQGMLDLTSDLIELAHLRQAKDQQPANAKPHHMADILKKVCDLLLELANKKNQTFEAKILADPVIIADRDHLEHIWINLISNAIKYTPEGGRITVSLQANEDNLIGFVEDSGIGIAEEDMQYLFQDFFRTNQAKASGEIGTGLGLSIVKQIVESYHGEIKAESMPGQGSRFTFVLPLDPHPQKGRENPTTTDASFADLEP
jgi:signal transduction histidine kinase